MSSIPLVALQGRQVDQPDALGNYAKIMQLRQMAQEQPVRNQILQQQAQQGQQALQQGQINLQNAQQAQKDQQITQAAIQQWDGKSYDDLADIVRRNGGSASSVIGIRQKGIDQKEQVSKLAAQDAATGTANLKLMADKNNMITGAISSVMQLPDDQLVQAVTQKGQELAQQGLLDPQHLQMLNQVVQTGDPAKIRQGLDVFNKGLTSFSQQIDNTYKQAQTAKASEGPNMQSVNLVGPGGKPVKANFHPDTGIYTDVSGQTIQNPVPWEKAAVINNGIGTQNDPKDIAEGIKRGDLPPTLKGLYRNAAAVEAELGRQGFPLRQAEQDWTATQKYLGTLNGAQQTRLRQAISFTNETLPQIQEAYNAWKATGLPSGFKIYNKAALNAAANLPGAAGSKAKNLQALIADFTSELGTVYKGGNSSTDESLKLAAQNLSADWNDQTFNDAMNRIGKSMRIRQNSMNLGTTGMSQGSIYGAPGAQPNAPNNPDPFAQFGGKAH